MRARAAGAARGSGREPITDMPRFIRSADGVIDN